MEYFLIIILKNIMSEEENFGIPLEQLEIIAREC